MRNAQRLCITLTGNLFEKERSVFFALFTITFSFMEKCSIYAIKALGLKYEYYLTQFILYYQDINII